MIIVVYAQPKVKGPPGRICFRPKEPKIEELVAAKTSGKYPAAAIKKAIGAMRSKKKELEDARSFGRGNCERYSLRSKTANSVPPEKSFSSKTPFWRDTCPSITWYYYFPRVIWYNREICWVLPPWNHLRCKRAYCRQRSCSGVKGTVSQFNQGFTFCGGSNYRYYYYYVWCRRAGLVRRFVRLPQCCSCKYLFCPWFQGADKS
ncbi:unnamed protein product [Mytilus edulis]|uniref:Uncharacterized protein n=1 Tax=Mytilus edulis TaxID=6550 RepID=A0A8S3R794_MYTED|nr:unnamed protein product [Mytilus edulis]